MSILPCISFVIVDSLVTVDNLPLTDESTITRGDCIKVTAQAKKITCITLPHKLLTVIKKSRLGEKERIDAVALSQ